MMIFKKILLIVLSVLSPSLIAEEVISHSQFEYLKVSYEIAKDDGFSNPFILPAIIYQESEAKPIPKPKSKYYGLGQMSIQATKEVLSFYPYLKDLFHLKSSSDKELKQQLINNHKFNITVTSKYLLILKEKYRLNGKALLSGYNRGPYGKTNTRYVKRVQENMIYLQRILV